MALTKTQLDEILTKVAQKGSQKLPSLVLPEAPKSVLPSLEQETANTAARLASVGVEKTEVTDTRNIIEKGLNLRQDQNFIFDVFEIINRPQQAIFGAINAAQKGEGWEGIIEGAKEGITGEETISGGDIVRNITGGKETEGLEGMMDWQNWAGFALDVFLDPADLGLALVTGGTSLAGQAAINGIDAAGDTAKIVSNATDVFAEGTKIIDTVAESGGGLYEVGKALDEATEAGVKVGKKVVNKPKKASELIQDMLLGKGNRIYKPESAEEYVRLMLSRRSREAKNLEVASLTSMTFKSLGAGFKVGTAMSDSIVEATLSKLDNTQNTLKQYQALKQSVSKLASEGGAKVKRAAGRSLERMNVVNSRLRNVHDEFMTTMQELAKEASVKAGKEISVAEVSRNIMNVYEYEFLTRMASPEELIDYLVGSQFKFIPYKAETIEDMRKVLGDDLMDEFSLRFNRRVVGKGDDAIEVMEFDSEFFSQNNYEVIQELKSKLPKIPPRKYNRATREAYEKALRLRKFGADDADVVTSMAYEEIKSKYLSKLDERVMEKYRKGYVPIEIRDKVKSKDTVLEWDELAKDGKTTKRTFEVDSKKYNAIKNEIEESDIKLGKHPQNYLENNIDITKRKEYYLTKPEREFAMLQLTEEQVEQYNNLKKYTEGIIEGEVKTKYPSKAKTGLDKKSLDKYNKARKTEFAKRGEEVEAILDEFLRKNTIDYKDFTPMKNPEIGLNNLENIADYAKNVYRNANVEIINGKIVIRPKAGASMTIEIVPPKVKEKTNVVFNPDELIFTKQTSEKVFDADNLSFIDDTAGTSFDPDTLTFKKPKGTLELTADYYENGTKKSAKLMLTSDALKDADTFFEAIEEYGKKFNFGLHKNLRKVDSVLKMDLASQFENGLKPFNKLDGNIRLGDYYDDKMVTELKAMQADDTIKKGVDAFKKTIEEIQRTIGIHEFGDADALITNTIAGYATHTRSQELTQLFKKIKEADPKFKNVDFAYFAPGRVRRLASRQYMGSAYEANRFRRAFYKEAIENDAWLKANLDGISEETKKAMVEYFDLDLFATEATMSIDGFMSDTYAAINKNHKTTDMLIAMSIGNSDAKNSAFRSIRSNDPIPMGYHKLVASEIYAIKNTILKNQQYEGTGFYVDKLLKTIDKSLSSGNQAIIEDHLYRMIGLVTNQLTGRDAMKLIDTFNSTFKVGKTLSPAFNIKNIFGNVTNQWLAGVPLSQSFKTWNRAAAMLKKIDELDSLVAKGGLDALVNEADKATYKIYQEFMDAGFMTKDSVFKLMDLDGTGIKTWADPNKQFGQAEKTFKSILDNPVTKKNMELNLAVDKTARLSLYLYAKENPGFVARLGIDPNAYDSAMQAVRLVHFDPNDLTFFEDDVMKRLIPFYTFTRQNLAFQLKNVTRHSTRYHKLFKAMDSWNEEMMGLSPEEMQSYQREQFYIPVFGNSKEGFTALKTSIPAAALAELSFSPQEMMRDVLSKASPIIKAPIEGATNTVIFTGQPIERFKNEPSKKLPMTTKSTEWLLAQVGMDVPAYGATAIASAIGAGFGAATGEKSLSDVAVSAINALNITSQISPADTKLSKMYNDLNALQDKVKELTSRGVKVPTMTELTQELSSDKDKQRIADLQRISDMISNIKR